MTNSSDGQRFSIKYTTVYRKGVAVNLIDPQAEISKLSETLDQQSIEIDTIAFLHRMYPDLKLVKNADKYLYCSHSAVVDTHEYSLTTFKMNDGIYTYVWPFTRFDTFIIRSVPPYIRLAKENDRGFGLSQIPGWEEQLASTGVSAKLINAVKDYLNSKPEINYMD